jgi:tetratricopeptide (TPR) repeat protein
VHPLQVESVAWVSETRGLLATFLGLTALLQYLAWREAPRPRQYLVAAMYFVMAMLAKPSATAVPLMAMVIDCLWYRRSLKASLYALSPWLLAAAIVIVITRWQQPSSAVVHAPPLWQRPFVAGDALAFYLGKLVLPRHLGFDYGRRPDVVLSQMWTWLAWLVPLQVVVAIFFSTRRAAWTTAALLALVAILPQLGFVPFIFQETSTVADRYMYLSMVGVALAAALAIEASASLEALAMAGVALGVLAAQTVSQCAVWRDDVSLYTHGLAVNPGSYVAHYGLGNAYQRDGRNVAAEAEYRLALDLNPHYAWALNALGVSLAGAGQTTEAIAAYRKAIASNPSLAEIHVNLANAYWQSGEKEKALDEYREALRLDDRSANAHCNYGDALIESGRVGEGVEHLDRAVTINPRFAAAHVKLGLALVAIGQLTLAAEEFRAALDANPKQVEAIVNLGLIAWQQGRADDALRDFDEALAIEPDFADALFHKGRLLLERGQRDAGLALLRRALERLPSHSRKAQFVRDELKKYESP